MPVRKLLASAMLTGALAASGSAQDNALLKQQEKLQQVAIQKVEAGIREAVADAQRLQAAGSTRRATERLRTALQSLDDPILPKKHVDAWRVQLTAAMTAAEQGKKPVIAEANPNREAEVVRLKAMIEEDKEIRRAVETVASLMKGNQTAQAKKEVDALKAKFPDNPTAIILPNLIAKTMTLEEVKAVHARQIDAIRATMVDLQRTATMAKIDYELPADWKEKTERRKPQLSPQLKAVLTALRTTVEIDKTNAPLSDVLKELQKQMGQPIILSKGTMQAAGIDQSTSTTVSPGTTVSARTALKMTLNNHGLTYVIRENQIQVVTRDEATSMMETRVYYIGDLITPLTGSFTGVPGRVSQPNVDPEQVKKNVENLIEQIKKGHDPASWKGGGSDGKGEITFHPSSMALIVKASAEVHGLMGNTLNK